jgi:signal transduction histidine kinase
VAIERDILMLTQSEVELQTLHETVYRDLFSHVGVALWIEDASLLKEEIDKIRSRGVYNFRTYLTRNPAELLRFLSLIRVVDVNQKAIDLLNATTKLEVLKGIRSFFTNESFNQIREEILFYIEGGNSYEYESQKQSINGTVTTSSIKTVIPDDCKNSWALWYVTETDITENKKLQLMLNQHEHTFEEFTSFRNKLLSAISHDLRNQFGNLIGFSDILVERFSELDDTKKLDYSRLIHQITVQTHELLNNLLNWAKMRDNNLNLSYTTFSFTDLLIECERQTMYLLKINNIIVQVSNNEEVYLTADYNIVSFVLRNILGNAIKFSKNDSIIDIIISKAYGKVIFAIKDYGTGMSEDEIASIYNVNIPQRIVTNEPESAAKGAGLGLILCRDFIKRHGGSIKIESQQNVGTTFTVYIPEEPR